MNPSRVYIITGPNSMFGAGCTARRFTSVAAFDSYVSTVRAAGFLVIFSNPFSAAITRPLC